ncbi:hypothetical protein LJB42_001913 [Komagataella kurtzmanii]|nr:hypothetical protein LJB42_001913 [Komagataella kurtzmanii]
MGWKSSLKQLLYSTTTNDRYADYKSNQTTIKSEDFLAKNNSGTFVKASLTSYPDDTLFNKLSVDPVKAAEGAEGTEEVVFAWQLLDEWCSKHELSSRFAKPVTVPDIICAQKDLGIEFPPCFVKSISIHDGQEYTESSQDSSGLIFGLELMSLDSIVSMTKNWRKITNKIEMDLAKAKSAHSVNNISQPQLGYLKNENHKSGQLSSSPFDDSTQIKPLTLPPQRSIPEKTIIPSYSHSNWIPVLTDYMGNHVALDLAPDEKGTVGQVILFGRDFDTKYLVARNWGDFLLLVAGDLESKNWKLDYQNDMYGTFAGLTYIDPLTKQEVSYFDVLKKRVLEQHKENIVNITR